MPIQPISDTIPIISESLIRKQLGDKMEIIIIGHIVGSLQVFSLP